MQALSSGSSPAPDAARERRDHPAYSSGNMGQTGHIRDRLLLGPVRCWRNCRRNHLTQSRQKQFARSQRQLERQEQLNQQRLRCELDDRTARKAGPSEQERGRP